MRIEGSPFTPARRGRPPKTEAQDRRNSLLDHALDRFVTDGYRATTMERLAATSGASKTTLYRQFGSKAALLEAAMDRVVPLLRLSLEAVDRGRHRSPGDVFRDYGAIIQAHHGDPGVVTLWRAVSEARDELGDSLADVVRRRGEVLAPVADYLAGLQQDGLILIRDPYAAAACFSELVSGGIVGFLGPTRTPEEQEASLDFALDLFLNGIR